MNPTPTIEGRSVTPRYHGSKTFGSKQKGALGNNDGERQKKQEVYIRETTTLHVHHAFLHIF